jgi:hypothetical protein
VFVGMSLGKEASKDSIRVCDMSLNCQEITANSKCISNRKCFLARDTNLCPLSYILTLLTRPKTFNISRQCRKVGQLTIVNISITPVPHVLEPEVSMMAVGYVSSNIHSRDQSPLHNTPKQCTWSYPRFQRADKCKSS